MYVVGQKVGGTEDDLEMLFDIVGSTGNLYTVTIKKEPRCNCPDGSQGNFCKHIIYSKNPFHFSAPSCSLDCEKLMEIILINGIISPRLRSQSPISPAVPTCLPVHSKYLQLALSPLTCRLTFLFFIGAL